MSQILHSQSMRRGSCESQGSILTHSQSGQQRKCTVQCAAWAMLVLVYLSTPALVHACTAADRSACTPSRSFRRVVTVVCIWVTSAVAAVVNAVCCVVSVSMLVKV